MPLKNPQTESKSIIAVPGFTFAGVAAGIKDDAKKMDVALIYSNVPGTKVAGVFTRNLIRAAPVRVCEAHVKGGLGRLIVINAGVANAATGKAGLNDAVNTARFAAKSFKLKTAEVLVCSTGKIGPRLPMPKLSAGILKARDLLHPDGFGKAALAICTTDAYPKTAVHRGKIGKNDYTIAVMAKGAGMISPDMATMLCFVTTDLNIPASVLKTLLKECVDETLNCMTVDGDTSTNDTVLILANGLSGNTPLAKGSRDYGKIRSVLIELLRDIAFKIVLDGEGATKCFEVRVTGAKTDKAAKEVARAIANSQLVKTAMFGNDPNWGRIVCAAGYSGAEVREDKMTVRLGEIPVFTRGKPRDENLKKAAALLRNNQKVTVDVALGMGLGKAHILASDLTYAYIKLNADYHT